MLAIRAGRQPREGVCRISVLSPPRPQVQPFEKKSVIVIYDHCRDEERQHPTRMLDVSDVEVEDERVVLADA